MTLVVIKSSGDVLIALADTKLTPENSAPWSDTDQSLKFVGVGKQWMVAYAGNTHWADITFKELLDDPHLSFSNLQTILIEANRRSIVSGSDVDFLLINIQTHSIWKITGGHSIKQAGSTSWIGDQTAFAKFQELFHLGPRDFHAHYGNFPMKPGGFDVQLSIGDEEHQEIHRKMTKAFRAIIADRGSPSVGGFPVTLILKENYARHWAGVMEVAGQPYPLIVPSKNWDSLRGEAGTGDFNYEIISTRDARDNIIVLLFPLSDRALVFHLNGRGIPYAEALDVDSATAEEALKKRFDRNFWRVRVHKVGLNSYEINADCP
jgi:hypothetical protein